MKKLEYIPFHGVGGLQNRSDAKNEAIEQNFRQLYEAVNKINKPEKPRMGRPRKEESNDI